MASHPFNIAGLRKALEAKKVSLVSGERLTQKVRDHLLSSENTARWLQEKAELLLSSDAKNPLIGQVPSAKVCTAGVWDYPNKESKTLSDALFRAVRLHASKARGLQPCEVSFPGLGKVRLQLGDQYSPEVLSGEVLDDGFEGRAVRALEFLQTLEVRETQVTVGEILGSNMYAHEETARISGDVVSQLRSTLSKLGDASVVDPRNAHELEILLERLSVPARITLCVDGESRQELLPGYFPSVLDRESINRLENLEASVVRALSPVQPDAKVELCLSCEGRYSDAPSEAHQERLRCASRLASALEASEALFDRTRQYVHKGSVLFSSIPVARVTADLPSRAVHLPWKSALPA